MEKNIGKKQIQMTNKGERSMQKTPANEHRQRWSSRLIFIFAAVSSAIGLGNIWRFPYMTYKYGGGAFLIPYLIAIFVLGIPLLMMELAVGQRMQKGAIDAFKKVNKRFGGIGFIAIFAGFAIVVYYAVVIGWAAVYLIKSFAIKLPWAADSESYFFEDVLHLTKGVNDLGNLSWPLFFVLLLVWVVIYFAVWKGTKSIGRVVLIMTPLPVLLLLTLFVRGITLPGSLSGILYYIKPDFSILFHSDIWLAAISQVFFSLSIASGIMIAYGSYNAKKGDITKNAFITALCDTTFSLLAGLVVFSVLGYMAFVQNVDIGSVAQSGPSLAFVVFPKALSLMPLAPLFSVLFFLMLFAVGITSAFSLVEAVNTIFVDEQKRCTIKKISFYVCSSAFLLGIFFTSGAGLYLLDIFDHFVTHYSLVLAGILEAIAVGWVYGAEKMRAYINSVSDWRVGKWWCYMIKYVAPLTLALLAAAQFIDEIKEAYGGYPHWAIALGWLMVIIPIVVGIVLAVKGKRRQN